jgi:hypothetical protein
MPNLRAALVTLRSEREAEFRALAGSLSDFFALQGLAEADGAVVAARETGDKCGLALALLFRAIPPKFNGDFATARALIDEAFGLLEPGVHDALLARTLGELTDLALNEHRWSDAATLAEHAIEAGRESNAVVEAISHGNRGMIVVAYELTRMAEALANIEPVRATRLLGASRSLVERLGAVPDPIEIEATARTSERLREQLTSEAFEAYHLEGSRLDQDAAVSLALA